MTEAQKQSIHVLRGQGLPFSRVAQEVGLSVNTVKSFCRRGGLPAKVPSKESEIKENKEENAKKEAHPIAQGNGCKCCGKALHHLPKAKPKQFCGGACRAKWWNARREGANRRGLVAMPCAHCGVLFMSYAKTGRKYCSHACYIRHRYKQGEVSV